MKPQHTLWQACACITLAAALTACGGGNGSSASSTSALAATVSATEASTESTVQALAATSSSTSRGSYTSAPVITTNPASTTVNPGASVSFSVAASGAATLGYQWRKDGTPISGATATTYTITSVATTDAGSYDVVVTNSKGSATSSAATLTVSTTVGGSAQTTAVVAAAQAFAATLSSSQQSTVQLAYTLDAARRWSNLPAAMVARNGLSWGSLSTAQKTAARTLISTALGSTGNALHLGMQMADTYLAANGGGSSTYGEGYYYIAFLGTPSTSGFWILQLTGHHLTFNIAFNGSYKSATPQFMGVEPKAAFTVNGVSYDPMQAQRVAWTNLGAALTAYSAAKLSGTYADLLFGANGSGGIDGTCPRAYSGVTEHGIAYSALSTADQALVQATIKAYVNTQSTEYADDLLAAYLSSSALASTYVAYAGTGTVTARPNYFRIEGPRVWIENSVQGGVIFTSDIHYHGIWRDKLADYGGKCSS